MKAVQVMFDQGLLESLDKDPDVRRYGRSAVLRRVAAEYLRRKRAQEIADAYRRAYGTGAGGEGLGHEFEGWETEGEWPEP